MRVDVKGLEAYQSMLQDLSARRINAATATALTRTAAQGKTEFQNEMRARFDRPTLWTLNSLMVKYATANDLTASVLARSDKGAGRAVPLANYLLPQAEGGRRRDKRLDVALRQRGLMPAGYQAVPAARVPKDGNGNVSGAFVRSMLALLSASAIHGPRAKQTRLISATRRFGGQVFVLPPGRGKRGGVFIREISGTAEALFWFVRDVSYRQRIAIDADLSRRVAAKLDDQMSKALAEQIERATQAAAAKAGKQ